MSTCSFCDIVNNETQVYKIYEDQKVLIFLDKRPLFYGHCLLIPKDHYETLSDLPPAFLSVFTKRLQQITRVVEQGMQAEGSFIAANNKVSQSVPHFHMHIVPRRRGDGLRGFFWPRQKIQEARQQDVQQHLQQTWNTLFKNKAVDI